MSPQVNSTTNNQQSFDAVMQSIFPMDSGTSNRIINSFGTAFTKEFGIQSKEIASTVAKAAPAGVSKGAAAAGAGTAAGLSTFDSISGAAYGIYDLAKNFGKMTVEHGMTSGLIAGASIGTMIFPGVGTVVGGLIGAVAGGAISLFKNSGKSKDQKERDQMRKALQQAGIIDQNYSIQLADGSKYNIGIDGKAKAEFGGRKPFEIDPQNPLAVSVQRIFLQMTQQLFGGNQNLSTSLAGYLTNAALSNAGGDKAKIQENIRVLVAQFAAKSQTGATAAPQPSGGSVGSTFTGK